MVAEYKNEIVGFAAYNKSSDSDGDRGEVYAIYVLKDYHKLGIGKALMDECIKRLVTYEYISVWVLHNNLAAILWYEHYGFKMDGKSKSVSVMDDYQLDELRMTLRMKSI
ncbi:MAG: GNAT family N-acetyltransferase [Acholeplasmataceae bacterium]